MLKKREKRENERKEKYPQREREKNINNIKIERDSEK